MVPWYAFLAALSQLPAVFSSEFVLSHSEADLGNFIYSGLHFSINFTAPYIQIYAISPAASTSIYNVSLEGKSDSFCGTFQKVGLGVVLLMIVIPVVLLAVYVQLRKARDDRLLGETLRRLPGMPREFRFSELNRATGSFAEDNKVGEGAYGKVYKGTLPVVGEIAVKSFSRETSRGDFLAELTIINRLRHRNLVSLLGWCYREKKLLLVYVYMPNGSLDGHLYDVQNKEVLSWQRRYHALRGVASALHYLHNDNDQKVVHRDIKSSNILLDSAFNACLGDFGLARAIDEENTSYEEYGRVPGTWGYIAPECLHTGKATGKSDVFSFGAVVLEVVCGRRPGTAIGGFRLLVDWVWTLYEEGRMLDAVDLRLQGSYDREEAQRMLLLGLACSNPNAGERPKTQIIVQIISKLLPPPPVPLPKPVFVLPAMMEREPATTDNSDLYPRSITYSSSWLPRSPLPTSSATDLNSTGTEKEHLKEDAHALV